MEYVEFFAECWDRMHSVYFITEVLPYWVGFLMGCIFAIHLYRRYQFRQYELERLARTAERMRRINERLETESELVQYPVDVDNKTIHIGDLVKYQ